MLSVFRSLPSVWAELITGSCLWPTHLSLITTPAAHLLQSWALFKMVVLCYLSLDCWVIFVSLPGNFWSESVNLSWSVSNRVLCVNRSSGTRPCKPKGPESVWVAKCLEARVPTEESGVEFRRVWRVCGSLPFPRTLEPWSPDPQPLHVVHICSWCLL